MKRMFFAVILLAAFSVTAIAKETVAEGKTFSALGDYKISLSEKTVTINGEEYNPFLISYQNTPMEVMVVVRTEENGKKYYVLSEQLSVQYVCNANYFGIEKLDKEIEKDGYSTSDNVLNRSEYFHQKVLTTGQDCELDNTMLIAAYFPKLINKTEELVASK